MDELKIFQVNDYDWVCATTKEEAVKSYLSETGQEGEEYATYDLEDIRECDLDNTKMRISEDDDTRISFREGIKMCMDDGSTVPFILCSTEW